MPVVASAHPRARRACRVAGAVCCLLSAQAPAAEQNADELAEQLANPVAALISAPAQLNWDSGLAANGLGEKWLLNIQPVVPLSLNERWNVISRTILPVVAESDVVPGLPHESGVGDVTQSFFLSPKAPIGGWIVGFGPALLLPTATETSLGNGKWGLGPTAVVLTQTPDGWTYGLLWNHIWSVAGSSHRPDLSTTFLQPFVTKALGQGITASINLESTYDWEGRHWAVPMNVTLSKVTKLGSQLVSVGGGVRYYFETPAGGPDWGLRAIFTLLFPK